ncbi:hypothetical protein [uncultured Winogradskyella sp.]|uniref:hypothetical protein n=1 Tax=uncultured Winogradskyella sp. TaxID=395353 RepID=UPI0026304C6A|nr:hypothetical protein [uncultured Winogradskyella sp.]
MKHFICIILCSLFLSCAGIKRYKNENQKKVSDIKSIEGTYNNMLQDSIKLYHNSFNGEINWRKKNRDTTSFETFKISVLNQKFLKIDFFKNDSLAKSRIIKYRLRNNGFVKLRNQNFRVSGIPYLLGEYDIMKYELGLTKDDNLILNGYKEQAGGLLIVLSSGIAYSVNHVYNRVE